jgi:hypothetical protein
MEESRQSALFIELLRSAICQRRKNNVMTVSNGQFADVAIYIHLVVFERSTDMGDIRFLIEL